MTDAVAFVGLGSNLGDRLRHIETAIGEIDALPETALLARSSLYESAPLEADGDDYLNAVAQVRTALTAPELLAALQAIEGRHGRKRPYGGAPRTLDLDLLLHGGLRLASPELTVPHPRLHQRAFVLQPLAELDPELDIPGRGRVGELLRGLGPQGITRWARP